MTTLKGLTISIAYVLGSSTPSFVTFIGGCIDQRRRNNSFDLFEHIANQTRSPSSTALSVQTETASTQNWRVDNTANAVVDSMMCELIK
jgi:hypothetical protein